MSILAELSPKEISVVSGRVLESIDDQEQYFLTFNEEGTENYDVDFIISTKSSSVWDVTINYKPFTQISDVELLDQIADHFRSMTEEMERMIKLEEFHSLMKEWKKERKTISSFSGDVARQPSYQRIVGMGPVAVPFILQQLQEELKTGEPDHWFWALWAITGADPIPEKSQGRIFEMAKAWLTWGERMGHLNAERVGTVFPKFR
jgi:hypothetical protein